MRPYSILVLTLAALTAGVVSATAAGDHPRRPPAPIVPAPVAPAPCPARTPAPAAAPSERLLGAFSVLRRERTATDELPREALDALRARGLVPADPASARLLRTTAEGGRAWVVPVSDVRRATPFGLLCGAGRPPRILRRPARPHPARPVPAPAPAIVVPAVPPRPVSAEPLEGLAVVALGGAPAGGGGARDDLTRGRAPVSLDPCAGPRDDMLGVSGIVPDGVSAAYLTSADGTAVRADVRDNAYAFVVPRTRRPEQRYVVWTGGDGTPHVQPLPLLPFGPRCGAGTPRAVRVTPEGGGCVALAPVPRRFGRRLPVPVCPGVEVPPVLPVAP